DEGTTFTLTLPYVPITAGPASTPPMPAAAAKPAATTAPPAPTLPAPTTQANTSIRGARILVADDEPGLVAIVRQLMQRSGAEVTIAHGGPAALEAVRAPGATFDVVI